MAHLNMVMIDPTKGARVVALGTGGQTGRNPA